MGQITATRNLVATKVVRHAGQWEVEHVILGGKPLISILCHVLNGWGFLYSLKGNLPWASCEHRNIFVKRKPVWNTFHKVHSEGRVRCMGVFGVVIRQRIKQNSRQLRLVNTLHLTHWGRVTHICASKLTINGSDNGLSPGLRQAII